VSTQAKGAILTAALAVIFIALQILLDLETGIAGVFIMGMAAGLWIGMLMPKPAQQQAPAA